MDFSSIIIREKQEEAGLGDIQHFALKALGKKAVLDRGQLNHVKDEKLLLQNMDHPLILKLFSTFQVFTCMKVTIKRSLTYNMRSVGYSTPPLPLSLSLDILAVKSMLNTPRVFSRWLSEIVSLIEMFSFHR